MLTAAIDCGLTGALAVIDQHGAVVALHDLPTMERGRLRWIDAEELARLIRDARDGRPVHCVVEATHAMPDMGTVAANSKGLTLGSTLAALQMAGIPFELVAPATWKAALRLTAPRATDRERKAASLSLARQLFPGAALDRVKDHNRAEALCLAHWHQTRRPA